MNSILNSQKFSQEIDDITAEALSDKMMSEVKSQEELHNLTIWYPLLTGSRKGMNSAINDRVKSKHVLYSKFKFSEKAKTILKISHLLRRS